jgi:hypothetical protein
MLKCAFLYELFARDVFVLIRQAHGEAKVDLWVGVLTGGAEFEHVTKALLRAVHAIDAVVVVGGAVKRVVSQNLDDTGRIFITHLPM